MSQTTAWIVLREIPGVGDLTLRRLVDYFDSPETVLKASEKNLLDVEGVGPKLAAAVVSNRSTALEKAHKHMEAAEKCGATILTLDDERYPRLLLETDEAPAVLYVRGDLDLFQLEKTVAIVGTRRSTAYGKKMTHDLSMDLAMRNTVIVSGLARGIDSIAHRAALEADGSTIAVLGCGIDKVYPEENRKLMDEIVDKGLVVSDFSPGSEPLREHFLKRNRIIAGLSQAVLVIEAPERSGALNTAAWAINYNRSAYAVPGPATARTSRGTNALIRDEKARLIQSWEDLADDLPVLNLKASAGDGTEAPPPEFSSDSEKTVFECLSFEDPVHIDSIALKTELSISVLLGHLLSLEIRDLIEQLPGKLFVRKH